MLISEQKQTSPTNRNLQLVMIKIHCNITKNTNLKSSKLRRNSVINVYIITKIDLYTLCLDRAGWFCKYRLNTIWNFVLRFIMHNHNDPINNLHCTLFTFRMKSIHNSKPVKIQLEVQVPIILVKKPSICITPTCAKKTHKIRQQVVDELHN